MEDQLKVLLLWVGRLAGLAGVLICAVAAVVRVGGSHMVGGYTSSSVLQAGIAVMLLGCLGYLALLARRP